VPSSPESLAELVMSRRVLVLVGAGGVGKTTTAAALAVAAARRGRRVLCLTIDPAKRLAESLGLERMSTEEQAIDPRLFDGTSAEGGVVERRDRTSAEGGVVERGDAQSPVRGSLTAMMLDTKKTFDELVTKHSSSPEHAARLLNNKLYKYVSTSLAGTKEYMAMEKLATVQRDPRFDLVVLDTPPTANALDFLDAPARLADAIDSATIGWFVQAFETTGKLSLNLLARSASAVLRALGRITGGGFLESMAEFIGELNDLFGGFKQRAAMVEASLRSPEVSFVLVTSPAPPSIQEVLFFSERLESSQMPRGAFVVNRFRVPPPGAGASPPTEKEVAGAIAARGLALGSDAPSRLVQAYRDAVSLAALDALHVGRLVEHAARAVPVVRVPELAGDVHDIAKLGDLAETMMAGGV
jgi:anion-transporting  ArsA/GET3 family ATPase